MKIPHSPILFFCLAALTLPVPAAFAQSMFRGGETHTGQYEPMARLSLDSPAWTFKAKGPVFSSAAVANGVAYFGSDDRNLYALDVRTGAVKWTFATGGIIRSSPAVQNGVVYFGSYDGNVYALGAADGKQKWAFKTGGERHFEAKGLHGFKPETQTIPDFWDMFASSPLVTADTVYIGSSDGNMYALDATKGTLRWKFQTGNVLHISPALADGLLYFGSFDSYFYAVDAATGALRWKFKTGDDPQFHNQTGIESSPAVVDGLVYFGCRDSNIYALDAKTGAKKWSNCITWVITSPAVADGKVYYGTSIPSFFIVADAKTGEYKSKLAMPMLVYSSPAVSGGTVYAGSFDGCLYAFDAKNGAIVGKFVSKASAAHHDELLRPDGSANTDSIFRSDDFEDMYRSAEIFMQAGAIIASPVVADGALYVGACDGTFYCFRK
jgi:outer membrane protein assembly factor BamB